SNKFLVRFFTVGTYTQYHISLFNQSLVVVAQVAGFGGASRGHILRIKVKHNFFTTQAGQRYRISVLVVYSEIRGFVARLECHGQGMLWVYTERLPAWSMTTSLNSPLSGSSLFNRSAQMEVVLL